MSMPSPTYSLLAVGAVLTLLSGTAGVIAWSPATSAATSTTQGVPMLVPIRVWWRLRHQSYIEHGSGLRQWPGWKTGTLLAYLRQQVARQRAGLPLLADEPSEPPHPLPDRDGPGVGYLGHSPGADQPTTVMSAVGRVSVHSVRDTHRAGPQPALPEPAGPVEHLGADEDGVWADELATLAAQPVADDLAERRCPCPDCGQPTRTHTRAVGGAALTYQGRHHADGTLADVLADIERAAAVEAAAARALAASYDTAWWDRAELHEMLGETAGAR